MLLIHIAVFVGGALLVLAALFSAIRTFVVPRGLPDRMTRYVFVVMRYAFDLPRSLVSKHTHERSLAFFAPVTLLLLPGVWLSFLLLGYMAIFWALGAVSWSEAFADSRLSLLYLGAALGGFPSATAFAFSETVFSLLLAALLVSFLPTLYSAFSRREEAVAGLDVRAGAPPSALTMLVRYQRIHGLDKLQELWVSWEAWFEVTEETHTALQPLVYYRSPQPWRSWVTAAGTVLDAAALTAACIDREPDAQTDLCIRAGYLCLRRIAAVFGIPFNPDPAPDDRTTVSRAEFDAAYDTLAAEGTPLKPDRDQCWRDFNGWRVNYDAVLVALAVLTMAPPAPWSSDRVPAGSVRLRSSLHASQRVAREIIQGRGPVR